nr:ribonuclease H-like domain, reverse transcriptase, RNA-dependent DNA polymerase [Tanacetum cinerariifolium]
MFENSSKNLGKLLDSQIGDKFKTGVGFDSKVFDNQMNDRYKIGEGYHTVPPSYTRNFMPPKPDLILVDKEEYVVTEFLISVHVIATNEAKTSMSEPKSGNPQFESQEKGVIDNGCARHMTGNMSYLFEYEEINGGYVTFRGDPKGDPLGKFDGKADEGFFIGYSVNSKTFKPRVNQEKDANVNSTTNINIVSPTATAASIPDNVVDENIVYRCVDDPNMPNLEEIVYSDDDEDVGAKADMTNMDVKSAFLYGKIEEEVYVYQPLGFKDPKFPDRIYKVEKALYGLNQALELGMRLYLPIY